MYGVSYNPMNGRLTAAVGSQERTPEQHGSFSYEDAKPQRSSNHWCCTENNRNNARNVNFNNGNTNNNNKYNSNAVRAVAALVGYNNVPSGFIQSVWDAYYDCLRGKLRSEGAVEYMEKAAEDIPRLARELWSGTYSPGTSTCFLVSYPKWREVFAANFRDRIVHHWVCARLEPLFEHRFRSQGNVSFNCRKGFGTEKAVEYAEENMERISGHNRRKAWVFRGDLVGFFMSIDKELLWYLLRRFMERWKFRENRFGWAKYGLDDMPNMYWDILVPTVRKIVMHHPEKDCILNSPVELWNNLDEKKSLFTSETGEPIGNLTTQQFANFLLSYLVAYIQHLYRGKNYAVAQFVDDFLLICDDLNFLVGSVGKIETFLKEKLRLTLHKDKRYLQSVGHGVLWVGSFLKPCRKYLSNRTMARLKEKCEGFGKMLNGEKEPDIYCLQRIEQTINSYLGFTSRRKTYAFRRRCIESMGAGFWKYFYVKGNFRSIRTRRKYQPIYY